MIFLKGGRSQEFQVVFNRFVISLGRYPEEIIQSITGLDRDFQSVNDEDGISDTSFDRSEDASLSILNERFIGAPLRGESFGGASVGNLSIEGSEGGSETFFRYG